MADLIFTLERTRLGKCGRVDGKPTNCALFFRIRARQQAGQMESGNGGTELDALAKRFEFGTNLKVKMQIDGQGRGKR